MKSPRLVAIHETHRGRRHLARIELEVDIEDLETMLDHFDTSDVSAPTVEAALQASKDARMRAERNAPAPELELGPRPPTEPVE